MAHHLHYLLRYVTLLTDISRKLESSRCTVKALLYSIIIIIILLCGALAYICLRIIVVYL